MHHISTLWKANTIAFISSFCVMVIELIASRILAPHIGVSLYTWTSIIGVILAGIALGNYVGGKIADRRPSPLVLAAIFLAGSLATIAILPATNIVTSANWFGNLPVMWNFILKTSFIFFLPAIILSMVSPMVIKLTLADLGR
ncbi:MAG: fused MFS/spermidine synthase, partial [Chloroflexi bacterium]|nr:fused MFS/spermidine synthase [Chloroflexota bacterium]